MQQAPLYFSTLLEHRPAVKGRVKGCVGQLWVRVAPFRIPYLRIPKPFCESRLSFNAAGITFVCALEVASQWQQKLN